MKRDIRVLLALAIALAACRSSTSSVVSVCRCDPEGPCWPSEAEWKALASKLAGKLEKPLAAPKELTNPFEIQEHAGGTQSAGWLRAWKAAQSEYAVAAASAEDVVAAVRFAKEHNLRVVIKGTGHDYLGRSSAPRSLLIWTHNMRKVELVDAFVAQGCPNTDAPIKAVSVGAGTRWLEAYDEVTVKHHRYVQGGGCTSVGAAGGFVQGGGFGSFSKKYGTAASSVLEAEVVTADGELRVANRCQNQDLFWALRGGGGGTFGVVTKLTYMTHELPKSFGAADGNITAKSDAAFEALLAQFLTFFRDRLNNEHWGEQIAIRPNNELHIGMLFDGLSQSEAEEVWQPLRAWINEHAADYTIELKMIALPAEKMWDGAFFHQVAPQAIQGYDAQKGPLFYWTGDQDQVQLFWYAYQARWLPIEKLSDPAFAHVLFQASREWRVGIHFNKGQAGAAPEAIARGKETSTNPALFNAAGLILLATGEREPNEGKGKEESEHISAAMKLIRDATPGAGTYVNETDYFEPDWQEALWGTNYPKLLALKKKYDPEGLFVCHHCVGSEAWSADGMCRSGTGE